MCKYAYRGWSVMQVLTEYPPASHTHAGSWPAVLPPAPSAGSSETWRNSPETRVTKAYRTMYVVMYAVLSRK
jgi:hypothetical protein